MYGIAIEWIACSNLAGIYLGPGMGPAGGEMRDAAALGSEKKMPLGRGELVVGKASV